jgi:hypothetical protein
VDILFMLDLGPVKSKISNNCIPREGIMQERRITPNPSQERGRFPLRKVAPIELRVQQLH